jgi:hypothetical protein
MGEHPLTDQCEQHYLNGQQAAYRALLALCRQHLSGGEQTGAWLLAERAETIALLRQLCAESGDNDWSDALALPDIIEKHLHRPMQATIRELEGG